MRIAGDLWIITDKAAEVAAWMDRSLLDPRYTLNECGRAIAVGFSSDDDEMLFRMMYPEFERTTLPQDYINDMCVEGAPASPTYARILRAQWGGLVSIVSPQCP